jgi:transposase InsO family protein
MVTQGYTATLVAATLAISRSSLYYRKRPRGSRADRTYDEQIVVACGEKPAYWYRRVTWWLRRKEVLPVNRKGVLRVMRERGLLVRSRRLRARRKKEWGRVEAARPNQIWQITPKENRDGSNQHPPIAARLRELIELGDDRTGDAVGIYACSLLLGTLRSEGKLPDFMPMRDPRDLFDQLAALL